MTNKVKVYGGKKSRAVRAMWILEELGMDYDVQPLDFAAGENKTPEYLALNPAGKVPTLVDGDFVLTESLAITTYLAQKYNSPLMPSGIEAIAKLNQWTLWALTEIEYYVSIVIREMKLGDQADQQKIKANQELGHGMVATLEKGLEKQQEKGHDYLLGDHFTLADLNTASVICFLPAVGISIQDYPLVSAWLGRCLARPAWQKLQD